MYLGTGAAKALWTAGSRALRGRADVPPMIYWLGATSLLVDVSSEMVTSVLPVFLFTVLSLSPLQVGVFDGLFQGLASLTLVFAAHRADATRNNRCVALAGYALSAVAVGLLLASTAAGALFALAALLLERLGKGVRTAPRDALIAAHAGEAGINSAFGVHRSMDAVGAFAGPLLASLILWLWIDRYDILLAVSLAFAVAGVMVFGNRVRNPPAAPMASSGDAAGLHQRLKTLLRCKGYRRLLLLVGGLGLFTVSDGMLFLMLAQLTQMPSRHVPLIYVGSALVFLLAAMPLARAADRWSARQVLVFGHLCLLAAYGCLHAPALGTDLRTVVVILWIGLFHAAIAGALVVMVVASVAPEDRTTGLALMGTVGGLAKLASSPLLGWLWQGIGTPQALAVFGGGLLLFIIALACGFPSRASRRSNAP